MIEDESDVFEITDFTTASEWERFIAKLEELIHEWKLGTVTAFQPLTRGELSTGSWEEVPDVINFADFKFIVCHHHLKPTDESKEDGQQEPEGSKATAPKSEAAADKTDSSEKAKKEESRVVDDIEECSKESIPLPWQDMMSLENDFPSRAHCLSRWYGLRDFVTLSPGADMGEITSESRLNILLSSVAIAINNTSCQVPVFVRAQEKWRQLYFGQFEMPGSRTSFEMVHLRNIPPQYNHLAGLLDVFKAKLASPMSPLPPVSVSVRFTYILQDWAAYTWPQPPIDIDLATDSGEIGVKEFGELPFGACEDPVSELYLSATWPSLSEEMIVDNAVYSDLDPHQAPLWCVRVQLTPSPQCLLGDYLEEFVQVCRRQESTDQLLGKSVMETTSPDAAVDISPVLQRLTDPAYNIPSLGTVVTKATSRLQIKPEEAPIATEHLNEILLILFPDAKMDSDDSEQGKVSTASTPCEDGPVLDGAAGGARGGTKTEKETTPPTPTEPEHNDHKTHLIDTFKQFKSAPSDSLTHKLAVCMCIVNHSYGGLRAVAHLWQEFVLEMRYRWENNYSIPGLDPGSPNMGCSILHQKLQMLNCCIERKKAREAAMQVDSDTSTLTDSTLKSPRLSRLDSLTSQIARDRVDSSASERGEFSTSSDDEFFECEDENRAQRKGSMSKQKQSAADSKTSDTTEECAMDTDQPDSKASTSQSDSTKTPGSRSGLKVQESESETSFTDSFTHQPEGRSRVLEDLRLLNIDEALYIPLTQEPAPMTEDMLEEHAEVLAKLGTSSEGAHLRARMQSACLLSDMEAFKAANPGCTLGDFVRWYSPRDWLEEEVDDEGTVVRKAQLSPRMQIPGNMWAEVWQSAKPVPARRQRRLFDDTKEAEKVLHWLAAMKPADVAARLMPMLIHAAIVKLSEQEESELSVVKKLLSQLTSRATKAMRTPRIEVKRFEELVRQLTLAETVITRAQSLLTKFNEEKQDTNISGKDMQQFVASLLELPEVNIVGAARGPTGIIIHRLFAAAQKASYMITEEEEENEESQEERSPKSIPDFPTPVGKEYILRTTVQRPAPWSKPTPQRMYCVLMKEDFRLAGAFSADTTFQ